MGTGLVGHRQYHAVEYFAGCKSWTAALTAAGYNVATFEILDDNVNQDMLSAPGFVRAMQYIFEVCLLTMGRRRIGLGFVGCVAFLQHLALWAVHRAGGLTSGSVGGGTPFIPSGFGGQEPPEGPNHTYETQPNQKQ